jgi:anaerobic ribonucleoside-triphosphate reductase
MVSKKTSKKKYQQGVTPTVSQAHILGVVHYHYQKRSYYETDPIYKTATCLAVWPVFGSQIFKGSKSITLLAQ